ncbi:MAG: CTP-dependent riboflavin kinase [Candidatus Heimdallarchaeota archaeon]|nr:CTP-dependent riboflavin kinase [Candidatus Heimdallarchaeota archaeon]
MKIFDLSSRELNLLIYFAQLRATEKEISITTSQIAEFFNTSQQTASRCLIRLNKELGLVSWRSTRKGSFVQINPLGLDILHQLRFELERALYPDLTTIHIQGSVFSGLGEGKYYISRSSYMDSFVKKLGFKPFHGTLNLRIQLDDVDRLDLIRGSWPVIIPGFEESGRQYGDVLCYEVKIPDISARVAAIVPRRTHYGSNVLELISEINLRAALNLKDGSELTINYSLDQTREYDK